MSSTSATKPARSDTPSRPEAALDPQLIEQDVSERWRFVAAVFVAFVLLHAAMGYSPQNPPPAGAAPGAPMPPQQLDDLVAPIALYPDPVVGEVLAACTYPMEIAEAEQWV